MDSHTERPLSLTLMRVQLVPLAVVWLRVLVLDLWLAGHPALWLAVFWERVQAMALRKVEPVGLQSEHWLALRLGLQSHPASELLSERLLAAL